jgi:transposase-like protein
MMNTNDTPKTLLDAVKFFSDYENCRSFMVEARWPDGKVKCPLCGSEHVTYMAKTRRWKCYGKHPRPQFTLKVGTIFEDSPIPLEKWLPALWLLVNCKNGISSYEVARGLGITQKSAWFMVHRLRFALHSGSFMKMSGEIEVDETFIGGKARNMHLDKREAKISGTGGKDKAAVLGFLRRGGEVRAEVIPTARKRRSTALSDITLLTALRSIRMRFLLTMIWTLLTCIKSLTTPLNTCAVEFTPPDLRTSGAC